MNCEMLSWSFLQISERKFDIIMRHMQSIRRIIIANLQLKFGEKTKKFSFYLAFCNSKYI
ncbi:MAG: hypothetical protein A3C48_00790 [Candidatus Nealsonbacteria bacterium RIFCSPHIGHO2_02_FULL_38_75]|nr:MAG: hypothetical protein A3C48_00790 [Candidatus Nealsonbacteria bacterium RIFCSPHIGHO2_02_FULL_38_75]OGZ25949.1 MAG: hypothetical protein A3I85_00700 [Candidatus Nealsonbacteria bacterium RIFCSPLOWO2_02_FULL_38_63]